MALEIVELLRPRRGARLLDGTLGGGGHARILLDRIQPGGILVGLDRDLEAVQRVRRELAGYGDALRAYCANFADLCRVLDQEGLENVDGMLFDLGLSSLQLGDPERGFSFSHEGPLDMRYDRRQGPTAAELLSRLSEAELADLLWRLAEERSSRRLARRIVERRRRSPLRTTVELAQLAEGLVPRRRRGRHAAHPATRLFQALRITVNRELDSLESLLECAPGRLAAGGRMAVICFHSLDDRLVKKRFRDLERDGGFQRITRRPLRPGAEECARNPRSRSARLRVLERVA